MSEDNFKKLAIPGFSNFIFNIYHKHLLLFLQSCGPGFESQTLHLRFFILIDLWCGKDENKWKRGRDWPILKKHIYYSSDTFFQNQMTWIQECYKTVIWWHTRDPRFESGHRQFVTLNCTEKMQKRPWMIYLQHWKKERLTIVKISFCFPKQLENKNLFFTEPCPDEYWLPQHALVGIQCHNIQYHYT